MIMRNPIMQREFRRTARDAKLSWGLLIFNSLLAILSLISFYLLYYAYDIVYSDVYRESINVFVLVEAVELLLLYFIVPTICASCISGEREKQTLEILLTTPLTEWQIIVGKLVASIGTVLLYIVSSIPILAIILFVGGITIADFVWMAIYVFVFAFFVGSLGIFFSTLFRKTALATIMTYVTTFLFSGFALMLRGLFWLTNVSEIEAGNELFYKGYNIAPGLCSPIESCIALGAYQTGNNNMYHSLCIYKFKTISAWENVTSGQWFGMSMCVQLVLGLIFLGAAVHLLKRKK